MMGDWKSGVANGTGKYWCGVRFGISLLREGVNVYSSSN
jgi:hypothetical protein